MLCFDFFLLLFALTELDFGLEVVDFAVVVVAIVGLVFFFEFDLADLLVIDFDFGLLFALSPTLGVITFALRLTWLALETVNEMRPFIFGTFLTTPLAELDNLGLAVVVVVVVVGLTVVGLDFPLDLDFGLMTELGGDADATNRLGGATDGLRLL